MKEENKLKFAITIIQYFLIAVSIVLLFIFRETNITIRLYLCTFSIFIQYIILHKKYKRKDFVISF